MWHVRWASASRPRNRATKPIAFWTATNRMSSCSTCGLPGSNGLDILRDIKRRLPEACLIVMTGFATVQSAVQAMKLGAYDYITKPFNFDELRLELERVTEHLKLTAENRLLREQLRVETGLRPAGRALAGDGEAVSHHRQGRAQHASGADPGRKRHRQGAGGALDSLCRPVQGQTVYSGGLRLAGADPDRERALRLCARRLHRRGPSKEGLLATAEGGTIFLDEIGELPIDLQAKLLRAIQEKEIRPVGGTRAMPINVRILAATNRDLDAAVSQGTFRRDLYFRLNVLTLRIPPLRERKQDIPLLIGHFLERINQRHREPAHHRRRRPAAMLNYDWPGNVRELENCHGARLHHLLAAHHPRDRSSRPSCATSRCDGSPGGGGQPTDAITPLEELEKQAILHAIQLLDGDKLEAARRLGIGKTTLYRKLKEYGSAL